MKGVHTVSHYRRMLWTTLSDCYWQLMFSFSSVVAD